MSKFPYVTSYTGIEYLVELVMRQSPVGIRWGQAVCNEYEFPKELEDKLWNNNDKREVIMLIYDHMLREEYQITEAEEQMNLEYETLYKMGR